MHVHFKVHGSGKELFGDGFAIWYAREPKIIGKYLNDLSHHAVRSNSPIGILLCPGPVFGYVDYFHGLAIFMDTYSNHNGPHNVSLPFDDVALHSSACHCL